MAVEKRKLTEQENQTIISLAQLTTYAAFPHTIPVFHEFQSGGQQKAGNFGSGMLARIRDEFYLLTAGHVLDDALEYENVALSRLNVGKGILLPLSKFATNWKSKSKRPETDYEDIAAIKLPIHLAKLLDVKRFLYESFMDSHDIQSTGSQYLIYGYPANSSRSKFYNGKAIAKIYAHATDTYRLDKGTPDGYNPIIEMLFNYSRDESHNFELQNQIAAHPKGMSGCGIWRMYSPDFDGVKIDGSGLRLVALAHTYCEKLNIIRATRIGHVLKLVENELV